MYKQSMTRVSLTTARKILGELVTRVRRGEDVVLTSHDKDVARIVVCDRPAASIGQPE